MSILDGKVALVTGASRGLGRAIAIRLARDGALVAVHYGASADAAAETVREIERGGGAAFALQADVGRVSSISALFGALDAELWSRTGDARFDILVNSAGINPRMAIQDTTEAIFDEVFAVNVKGTFFMIQQALPRLRDGGRIINLSSILSRVASPQLVAYSATKGAINVLTQVLAADLGPRGITVNALSPGPIDTDMNASLTDADRRRIEETTALRRFGQPDDVASVAAFLASGDSGFVTAQYIEASGGLRI